MGRTLFPLSRAADHATQRATRGLPQPFAFCAAGSAHVERIFNAGLSFLRPSLTRRRQGAALGRMRRRLGRKSFAGAQPGDSSSGRRTFCFFILRTQTHNANAAAGFRVWPREACGAPCRRRVCGCFDDAKMSQDGKSHFACPLHINLVCQDNETSSVPRKHKQHNSAMRAATTAILLAAAAVIVAVAGRRHVAPLV